MKLDLLASLNIERAARRAAVLVTDLENGTAELVKASDLSLIHISEPTRPY